MSIVTVFFEKTSTELPMYADTPVSASPAVTKGRFPGILSALFRRLPLVDFPNSLQRLNLPHFRLLKFANKCFSSSVSLPPPIYIAQSGNIQICLQCRDTLGL